LELKLVVSKSNTIGTKSFMLNITNGLQQQCHVCVNQAWPWPELRDEPAGGRSLNGLVAGEA
jgi:hypothetical protein